MIGWGPLKGDYVRDEDLPTRGRGPRGEHGSGSERSEIRGALKDTRDRTRKVKGMGDRGQRGSSGRDLNYS